MSVGVRPLSNNLLRFLRFFFFLTKKLTIIFKIKGAIWDLGGKFTVIKAKKH